MGPAPVCLSFPTDWLPSSSHRDVCCPQAAPAAKASNEFPGTSQKMGARPLLSCIVLKPAFLQNGVKIEAVVLQDLSVPPRCIPVTPGMRRWIREGMPSLGASWSESGNSHYLLLQTHDLLTAWGLFSLPRDTHCFSLQQET